MRNGLAICGLAVLAFMAALIAPAITTAPVFVLPTVDQAVSTYDTGLIPDGSDNGLSGLAKASIRPIAFFAKVAGLVAARGTVRHGPMNSGPLADDIANTFRSGS